MEFIAFDKREINALITRTTTIYKLPNRRVVSLLYSYILRYIGSYFFPSIGLGLPPARRVIKEAESKLWYTSLYVDSMMKKKKEL